MADWKNRRKIRTGAPPPTSGKIKAVVPPDTDEIRFSFKYLHPSPPVSQTFAPGYHDALLLRLRDVSKMTRSEFLADRSRTLKSHGIDWATSSVPAGFDHILDPQLRDYAGYQFAVDRFNYGRVVGLLVGSMFYVCWLDPAHETCPSC